MTSSTKALLRPFNKHVVTIGEDDEQVEFPLNVPLDARDLTLHEACMIFSCSNLRIDSHVHGSMGTPTCLGDRPIPGPEGWLDLPDFLSTCTLGSEYLVLRYVP